MQGGRMLEGSCHCGKVKWSYPLPLDSVTACNCTLCSRYGALWAYGYLEDGIKVEGPTKDYSRGSKINGYHFCTECGCLAYYMQKSVDEKGRTRLAVNTRMALDPEKMKDVLIDPFDGRDSFEDQPRDGRKFKDLWA
jgi:hypothetical protein